MTSEKFCLRWNDFESHISGSLKDIRDARDFFDVTLVCEEEQLQAHKVIISACSPFFRNILQRNPHQHPLVYLKGVKYAELQSVLNFMYHGEANIAQDDLNSFLAVAEELKVKGLTQNQSEHSKPLRTSETKNISKIATPHQKIVPKLAPTPRPADDDIQEILPVKSEPGTAATQRDDFYAAGTGHDNQLAEYGEESYETYDEYDADQSYGVQATGQTYDKDSITDPSQLLQFVRKDEKDGRFYCTICEDYSHTTKHWTRNHIEAKHFPDNFVYKCDQCSEVFKNAIGLNNHRARKHKNSSLINTNSSFNN